MSIIHHTTSIKAPTLQKQRGFVFKYPLVFLSMIERIFTLFTVLNIRRENGPSNSPQSINDF